ncbi:alpha/beta hydrolase [Modestobacter sp. VKM Ac-2986]|uniref:alpha/beta hydrolase n=1 Tax=Modestobacter sp. VKM Ac-2986 TaxID=3004140 RepID=UPI0022ABAF21|nr:alpha/beta hydrolase [Modestobacter sp. VKM Ac-2986]MCZ2830932.1 alpha/beta hydrolase [Modestobacter sp. VKM Ac-2986]
MVGLDARVQVFGRLMRAASRTGVPQGWLAALGGNPLRRGPVTDGLLGPTRPLTVTDGTVAGQVGPLAARTYRPADATGPLPLVLAFHGGGWVLGSLDAMDRLCRTVAAGVGAVVVSVDYRLAPAHPWPAAAEDCLAATADVAARAEELGGDATRLAVLGDSAGGNLAAVVSLMARDRGGPPIAVQALLYPATDLTMSSPSMQENADAPVLTRATMLDFAARYLAGADPVEPYASPLLTPDHTGLPPALVQVAEHDPLRDDGVRYAAVLRAAGVPVRLTEYVGMPHGYLDHPWLCRSAPQAAAELVGELRTALGARAAPS